MRGSFYRMTELCDIVYIKDEICRRGRFSNLGYESIAWFDKGGTQAALLRRDGVYYLVSRGSDEPGDWLRNVGLDPDKPWYKNLKPLQLVKTRFGKVHKGFNDAVDQIWPDVCVTVAALPRGTRFIMAGHSKGGPEALNLAERVNAVRGLRVRSCWTIEAPRSKGRFAPVPAFDVYHLTNNNDPVVQVPWPIRFKHVGQRWYLDRNGELSRKSSHWDHIAGRFKSKDPLDGIHDHPAGAVLKQLRR